MKLKHAEQVDFNSLKSEKFDLIIAASGYETRATRLSETLNLSSSECIVIAFKERKNHSQRITNDRLFKKLGFKEYEGNEGSCEEIINILNQAASKYLFKEKLKILIDYSCMTKVWYATIINFFLNKYSEVSDLNLTFSYTPSLYSDPLPHMPHNKYMGPVPGIFCVSTSNKPTALVLGLGYEKERAKGIMEYLDPQKTYAFYSDPAFESRFVERVEKNNQQLLNSIGSHQIFKHPVDDLKTTDGILTSLCLSLKSNYRLILAPLGPKPFALLCILLAARYPDIDVWRVSAVDSDITYDRPPAEREPVICKATFVKERDFISSL